MAAPGEDLPPGEPGIELDRIQAEYNSVRQHAAIGYVAPTTSTTAAAKRSARAAATARPGATGPHRIPSEHHPEENQRSRAARGCVFPPRPGSLSRHTSAC
jgi:hypothetical protein